MSAEHSVTVLVTWLVAWGTLLGFLAACRAVSAVWEAWQYRRACRRRFRYIGTYRRTR